MLDIFYIFSFNDYEIVFLQLRFAVFLLGETFLDIDEDLFESILLLLPFFFLRNLVNANFLFLGLFFFALILD